MERSDGRPRRSDSSSVTTTSPPPWATASSPDVWTTIQVPMNTARKQVRDDIFPAFATIAKGDHVGQATGVAADDIAFVKSHFVLIGGIVIPGDGSDAVDTAVVDIDVVCKALAGDLNVPTEHIAATATAP